MSDEVAKVGIGIEANDRSAKGFEAVEKRAKVSAKRIGDASRQAADTVGKASTQSARRIACQRQ